MTGSSFPAWLTARAHHADEELALAVKVLRHIVLSTREMRSGHV